MGSATESGTSPDLTNHFYNYEVLEDDPPGFSLVSAWFQFLVSICKYSKHTIVSIVK